MGEKNYGKSVRAKLLNISKAEKLGYQLIVIRYIQERLLYRLSQSRFREKLFLKGGALLYAHEQFRARPTLDIDFLGDKIKVIHTAINDNNSTFFQEETLMVEVVFKGWVFNRPNMVWADVKKDTYIKSQSIDTLSQIGLT